MLKNAKISADLVGLLTCMKAAWFLFIIHHAHLFLRLTLLDMHVNHTLLFMIYRLKTRTTVI
jgi:hypothetical protein